MRKKQIAAIAFGLWLTIAAILMFRVRIYDPTIFFAVGFIGFLGIVELLEPRYVQPGPIRYKNYLLAVGMVIFLGIVILIINNFRGWGNF
jgi:uncharacterized membrane protein